MKTENKHAFDLLGRKLHKWDIIAVADSYGSSVSFFIIYSFSQAGIYGSYIPMHQKSTLEEGLKSKIHGYKNRHVYLTSSYSTHNWDSKYGSFAKRCVKIPTETLTDKELELYNQLVYEIKLDRNEETNEEINMKI